MVTRSTSDLVLRFHVSACGGRPIQGALVYATAVPFEQFNVPPEAATGSDGWATLTLHKASRFPASSVAAVARRVRPRPQGGRAVGQRHLRAPARLVPRQPARIALVERSRVPPAIRAVRAAALGSDLRSACRCPKIDQTE